MIETLIVGIVAIIVTVIIGAICAWWFE